MLASPLLPSVPTNFNAKDVDSSQYRPTKDLEAFNSLLPPPIEFVEGSSSGVLAVAEGRYEPINPLGSVEESEMQTVKTSSSIPKPQNDLPPTTPAKSSTTAPTLTPTKTPSKIPSLWHGDIDLAWPKQVNLGSGLYNTGNTCFLNSALQCLLHTPPLLQVLQMHRDCKAKNFCMTCALRNVASQSFGTKAAFSPSHITSKLQIIAKHMRRGRQEDSHEFLRYAVDALQKSCLVGLPPKPDHKLTETTWVHKVFGGRLRSRVTCRDCGHNSDTFDSILDLSIDIYHQQNLTSALRKFVAPDYLKGADKYKCEKCKKHVNAEKRFSIHDAPAVLTVHFKRFSPLGQKIGHPVAYDEQLTLQPFMSDGQFGPQYTLYGVICHAGGGPHSGHYFAFVKSRDNKWYEMNDESVTPAPHPLRLKNAYMLFYLKNKGQKLDSITFSSMPTPKPARVIDSMKKKRAHEDDEDAGEKVSKSFLGPLSPATSTIASPSDPKRQRLNNGDPQATKLKKKIQEAQRTNGKANGALSDLAEYSSDEEPPKEENSKPSAPSWSTPPAPSPAPPKTTPISAESFYGPSPSSKKRPDTYNGNHHSSWKKAGNPWARLTNGRKRGTPRGI